MKLKQQAVSLKLSAMKIKQSTMQTKKFLRNTGVEMMEV